MTGKVNRSRRRETPGKRVLVTLDNTSRTAADISGRVTTPVVMSYLVCFSSWHSLPLHASIIKLDKFVASHPQIYLFIGY